MDATFSIEEAGGICDLMAGHDHGFAVPHDETQLGMGG
jgi:hypothetical protein